jgi:hypothetical protein
MIQADSVHNRHAYMETSPSPPGGLFAAMQMVTTSHAALFTLRARCVERRSPQDDATAANNVQLSEVRSNLYAPALPARPCRKANAPLSDDQVALQMRASLIAGLLKHFSRRHVLAAADISRASIR